MSSRKVSEIVSSKIGDTITNVRTWGTVMYNVKEHDLVGGGVTDDTTALQTLVDLAITEDRKVIFFPTGTYKVTALTNDDQVVFMGDNASFTGGYSGTIHQLGDSVSEATFDAHEADYAKEVVPEFNVVGYGAPEDGVSDSLAATNLAIAAAVANGGGIIRFPAGSFVLSAAPDPITTSGIYFKGEGIRATKIYPTSNTAHLFNFGDTALSTIVGVGVSDLTIQYNTGTKTAGVTFAMINCQRYLFDRVEIIDAFTIFQLGSATDIGSNFCVIRDVIGNCVNSGLGIHIVSISGVHLERVQLNSESGENCTAIQLPSTTDMDTLVMSDCLFQRFTYGMLSIASAGTVQNIFASNTIFDSIQNYPVNINLTGTAILTRVHFDTCWFNSLEQDGIILAADATSSLDGVYFSDSRIIQCFKRGVLINSQYPVNVELDNCVISGCSAEGSGLYSAFVTAASATKWRITNSIIGDEGEVIANQSYGIEIGADNDKYTISNNNLTGNVNGAINDAGGVTFTYRKSINNEGYNPVGALVAPAVPTSTVAQKNLFSFPVQVHIHGGTVTAIAKNGTTITGMIGGQLQLEPQETITITYSVVPSWTWFGM